MTSVLLVKAMPKNHSKIIDGYELVEDDKERKKNEYKNVTRMNVHMNRDQYVYMYVYIYIYICVCVCVFIDLYLIIFTKVKSRGRRRGIIEALTQTLNPIVT